MMIFQFYTYLMQSLNIILVLLFTVFMFKGIRRKIFAPFLSTALIIGLIGNLIVVLENDMKVNLYGIFLISIGFFLIFLHFEALTSSRPNWFYFTILLGLNSMLFIITLIKSFDLLSDDLSYSICRKIIAVGTVIAFSRIFFVEIKVNQNAKIRETKIEFIAILLLLIYSVIFFIRDVFIQEIVLNSLTSTILLILLKLRKGLQGFYV